MTTELTKAAPNNHGPIYETDLYDFAGWLTTRPGVMAVGSSCEAGPMAEAVGEYIKTFPERFALTQRPAAQTERDTGPRVLREVFALCEDTMDKMAAESTEFSRGRAFEAKGIARAIGTWFQDEYCGQSHMGEPSLPAPQQATPEWLHLKSYGYAPGNYMSKCLRCGQTPAGLDKRATSCRPCAEAAYADQQATPEPVGEPWGWAIEDKHGVAQAVRPARKEFFGCVQSTDPFTAEDVSKMDREWAGLAPHRIVTLYTRPAPVENEPVGERATVPLDALHAAERERDYWKTRARAMLDHAEGTCWYWMGDGEDHLESLVSSLPVVIRADQLRELLARPAPGVPEPSINWFGTHFTYKNQPCDNVTCWRLGEAARSAKPGGDLIDHGLSLLHELEKRGYGVYSLAAAQAKGG